MAAEERSTQIWHHGNVYGDSYRGKRSALIAEGICKREWFPSSPQPGRRGGVKRVFKFVDGDRLVVLRDKLRDTWHISIKVPLAEQERRRLAAEQNERIQAQHAIAAAVELVRNITYAPPVDPDSITDREFDHLRVLRTLSERGYDEVLRYAHYILMAEAKAGRLIIEQRPARRLELVVDNDK